VKIFLKSAQEKLMSALKAHSSPATAHSARAMRRLDELARYSDEPDQLTRLYLTPAHKAAVGQVQTWMEEAGLRARIDAVGNVVGRYEGTDANAPTLLIGSHIDTVRNAGKYDGPLGVIVAIEAIAELHANHERMPFPMEVIAFGDEEGVRFPVTLTGSKAVSGTLNAAALGARDADGFSIRDALAAFGCPADVQSVARKPKDVRAYLEVHIEQGPVLEARNLPIGVVTGISGASRLKVTVSGTAGHAGTVPMNLRRDAAAAAAEMILTVERRAVATEDLVATVGCFQTRPGAVNVIAAEAEFFVDLRSPSDRVRSKSLSTLQNEFAEIAGRRRVGLAVEVTYDQRAASCDPQLVAACDNAVRAIGLRPFHLPSGAGHDGLTMIALCPIAMLFVRCGGGISHSPAESVIESDVGIAISALIEVIRQLSVSQMQGAESAGKAS
jgi:allantoate deiminase